MKRGFFNFVKGMGIGIAVGCMAGAVGNQYMHSGKKGMKRNVEKALKNMSGLVEEISEMF